MLHSDNAELSERESSQVLTHHIPWRNAQIRRRSKLFQQLYKGTISHIQLLLLQRQIFALQPVRAPQGQVHTYRILQTRRMQPCIPLPTRMFLIQVLLIV